jgi:hypothetical protein
MLPVPGPGTEDSVTSDSDLQQSLSLCWGLLPAVSSLTVMPQLTCLTTDTGLGGIHYKLSPRKTTTLFLHAQCHNILIEHDKRQDEDMMLQLISQNTSWIIEQLIFGAAHLIEAI